MIDNDNLIDNDLSDQKSQIVKYFNIIEWTVNFIKMASRHVRCFSYGYT